MWNLRSLCLGICKAFVENWRDRKFWRNCCHHRALIHSLFSAPLMDAIIALFPKDSVSVQKLAFSCDHIPRQLISTVSSASCNVEWDSNLVNCLPRDPLFPLLKRGFCLLIIILNEKWQSVKQWLWLCFFRPNSRHVWRVLRWDYACLCYGGRGGPPLRVFAAPVPHLSANRCRFEAPRLGYADDCRIKA